MRAIPPTIKNCPSCGVSLEGYLIPKELQPQYQNRTRFTRLVECRSIDMQKVVGFECPDCGEFFKTKTK